MLLQDVIELQKAAYEQMEEGELYWVLIWMDSENDYYELLAYREHDESGPRVYSRDYFDGRLAPAFCSSLGEATKALKSGAIGALLPLSILVKIQGKERAREWHKFQRANGMAERVQAYVEAADEMS